MMPDYLYHHGIKGQRWGVRRYQNKDGSYTSAGKKRYADMSPSEKRAYDRERNRRREKIKAGLKVAATAAIIGGTLYNMHRAQVDADRQYQYYQESRRRARDTYERTRRASSTYDYYKRYGSRYRQAGKDTFKKHARTTYKKAKEYSVDEAKEYLQRMMKRAAQQEANGGMDIDTKNAVMEARDILREAKARAAAAK